MRISTLVLSAALLIPGASLRAQVTPATTEQVTQRERDMWGCVKEHNFVPFRAALDSTYTSITQDGVHGVPTEAARYQWTSLERYELSDFAARQLDSETVLLTYKADIKGKSLGINVAGIYWMATIWRFKNGAWLALFHTEVKG